MSSDNSTRSGSKGLRSPGVGLPYSVHCLPCGQHFGEQRGGGRRMYAGVQRVWYCAACNANWLARHKERAARVGGVAA